MLPWLCICTAEVKDEDIHTLAAWPNLFFGQRRRVLRLDVCDPSGFNGISSNMFSQFLEMVFIVTLQILSFSNELIV